MRSASWRIHFASTHLSSVSPTEGWLAVFLSRGLVLVRYASTKDFVPRVPPNSASAVAAGTESAFSAAVWTITGRNGLVGRALRPVVQFCGTGTRMRSFANVTGPAYAFAT